MELLEGETLREALASGPLSARRATDYAVQMALGLAAAHEKGIVHRDLKPDNVFVTRDERIKILDFGLAKASAADWNDASTTHSPTVSGYTEPGKVLGTVGYMSPEQVRGLPLDHRSDIFSFGSVLYEMVTGRRAFQHETAAETMTAILKEEPLGPTVRIERRARVARPDPAALPREEAREAVSVGAGSRVRARDGGDAERRDAGSRRRRGRPRRSERARARGALGRRGGGGGLLPASRTDDVGRRRLAGHDVHAAHDRSRLRGRAHVLAGRPDDRLRVRP